jgi:hypothetical protein
MKDTRGKNAKEGLKFPMGSAHWEKAAGKTSVADEKYASEMNANEEYKSQVDALASYTKKHKMKY